MTHATLELKPSQIHPVKDMLANGELDDRSLNDEQFEWPKYHDSKKPRVMNDVSYL